MKLMIASDIHGSLKYFDMLLNCLKKEQPDRLILLGDLLYHGPRNDLPEGYNPKEVLKKLNEIRDELLCVRGNCDGEVDQMVLDFSILADYAYVCVDDYRFFVTHGHHYNENNLPPHKKGDILLCGHTHISDCKELDDLLYINPGSISLPKENTKRGYIIYESASLIWKDLEGKIYREYNLL